MEDELIFSKIREKNRKRYKSFESILGEWYGEERAEKEISSYLPKAVSIQDTISKIMSSAFGSAESKLLELQHEWSQIAGPQIASISKPVSIKDGLLIIEVKNSAWLMELKIYSGKMLEGKLKTFLGNNFKKIIFTQEGKNAAR